MPKVEYELNITVKHNTNQTQQDHELVGTSDYKSFKILHIKTVRA